ncbi:MAG: hypothetical protein HOM96_01540 [Rickettsiales bacterium]|jgi:hypothetical protein|nr:hypothetical protein [Rickettsiales bacterium]
MRSFLGSILPNVALTSPLFILISIIVSLYISAQYSCCVKILGKSHNREALYSVRMADDQLLLRNKGLEELGLLIHLVEAKVSYSGNSDFNINVKEGG